MAPTHQGAARLTVLFITTGHGHGPWHACVSVAQHLAQRGHRVVLATTTTTTTTSSSNNSDQCKLRSVPDGIEVVQLPLQASSSSLALSCTELRKHSTSPLEALRADRPEASCFASSPHLSLLHVDTELGQLIAQLKPEVIVVNADTVVPCVHHSYIPWVRLASSTPLACLPSEHLPPSGSGYPTMATGSSRAGWEEFREAAQSFQGPFLARLRELLTTRFKVPPPPPGSMIHPSPYLNMYAYPDEVDYLDRRPLPPNWLRFDHFVRRPAEPEVFAVPEKLQLGQGQLIYVYLGATGSGDVELVKRLMGIWRQSPNRFILSLGAATDQLPVDGAPNQWAGRFLPQMALLAKVDLVITAGGTVTVLESLYQGRSMIVAPLYGQHFDNAQRIEERRLGVRISPYEATEQEWLETIERVLRDEELKERLRSISHRMQQSKATEKAAIEVEKLAGPI